MECPGAYSIRITAAIGAVIGLLIPIVSFGGLVFWMVYKDWNETTT